MFTNLSILLKSIPVFLPFIEEIFQGRRKNVGGKAPNVLRPWVVLLCLGLVVAIIIAVNNFFAGFRTQSELERGLHRVELERDSLSQRNQELVVKVETLDRKFRKADEALGDLTSENRELNTENQELLVKTQTLEARVKELDQELRELKTKTPGKPMVTVSKPTKLSGKTHAILQEVLE